MVVWSQDQPQGKSFQGNEIMSKEIDRILARVMRGNMNSSRGTKPIFGNIYELRGTGLSRIYFRNLEGGIEILGYSNKNTQEAVINRLIQLANI